MKRERNEELLRRNSERDAVDRLCHSRESDWSKGQWPRNERRRTISLKKEYRPIAREMRSLTEHTAGNRMNHFLPDDRLQSFAFDQIERRQ